MVRLSRLHLGPSRRQGEPRYFPCWNLHDGTLASAAISALFSAACIGYIAYQLHQVSRYFIDHQKRFRDSTPGPVEMGYHDKNGREINIHEYAFIISQAATEKALCSAALASATLLLGCCVVLVRAAIERRRLLFLPWMIATVLLYCTATALILYNCTIYGFGGANNILLLTWIALGFVQVHCGRCVFHYYRYLRQPTCTSRSGHAGVAVFDPTSGGQSIYAISGSSAPVSTDPVPLRVTMTPPPYDEVANQPTDGKYFFSAPETPKEKPPEYSPH